VVLVTLGGCHLLDGLVACDSVEACEKLVWCSGGGFVRGIVLTPRRSRRATLVEHVIELPSLVGRFLRCPIVWARFMQHLLATEPPSEWST
jgi:hypothetical protein